MIKLKSQVVKVVLTEAYRNNRGLSHHLIAATEGEQTKELGCVVYCMDGIESISTLLIDICTI